MSLALGFLFLALSGLLPWTCGLTCLRLGGTEAPPNLTSKWDNPAFPPPRDQLTHTKSLGPGPRQDSARQMGAKASAGRHRLFYEAVELGPRHYT